MSALFFTISNHLSLMIIPDTDAHLNGHAVITYTYSIFKDRDQHPKGLEKTKENELHLIRHTDPDYMGYITFVDPDRLFQYTPDGAVKLDSEQVEEIIEEITYYRNSPELWRSLHERD